MKPCKRRDRVSGQGSETEDIHEIESETLEKFGLWKKFSPQPTVSFMGKAGTDSPKCSCWDGSGFAQRNNRNGDVWKSVGQLDPFGLGS